MKEHFSLDSPPVPPDQLRLLLRDGQSQIALLSLRYSSSVFKPREEHRHRGTLGTQEARTSIAPGEVHQRTIKSRGAHTLGTHSCLEPLRILIGVGVLVELDVVVAFK